MALKIGDKAPDFQLFDTDRKLRSLNEFAGSKMVIAFFPGAFTGVCTKEMCAFRDSMSKLNDLNAKVVGISVDAPFANKAFANQNNLQFPLLSDYERTAAASYGSSVTVEISGVSVSLSGLTTGSQYYLSDTLGTVATSAGSNSRKVGIAVSATQMLITNIW